MIEMCMGEGDEVDRFGLDGRRLGLESVESGERGLTVEVECGLTESFVGECEILLQAR